LEVCRFSEQTVTQLARILTFRTQNLHAIRLCKKRMPELQNGHWCSRSDRSKAGSSTAPESQANEAIMTTYLDLYAATHEHAQRGNVGVRNLNSARSAGYSESGIRSLVSSMFTSAR